MDKLGQQIFADELYPASIEIFSYDEYFYPNHPRIKSCLFLNRHLPSKDIHQTRPTVINLLLGAVNRIRLC